MSADEVLLRLDGVHTHVGAYHLLHGVDFDVPAGRTTLLLGRNGAGKTTTLRTVMGLWKPSAGSVRLDGEAIGGLSTPAIAARGVAYVPENMGIFADLSVAENLLLAARGAASLDAIDPARLRWIFELFPPVRRFWNQRAGLLSGGQKQMLAVARAIVEPRRLILVDEPSKGLAPAIIGNMIEAFAELKRARTTMLLVEQNFEFARRLGDTVAVMDDGRIVHRGDMSELAEDESLQQRLLGLGLGAHQ
ncbi:MAG: ABC transporter ATP-binding protein [Burkholderiaceae bacterium]|nr:ABC transporter ATP-binding protein [Burkholderiaceae bacterium]